jgi:M6 family metalloprotease-like protein
MPAGQFSFTHKNMLFIRTLACLLFLFPVLRSYPQPVLSHSAATPWPVDGKKTDGKELKIPGRGNSLHHLATIPDGYPVVMNTGGFYEYAVKNGDNKWTGSEILASDPEDHRQGEKQFLTSLSREISVSTLDGPNSAISGMTDVLKAGSMAEKAMPVSGTVKILVLLIRYTDLANTYAVSDFDDLMNEANYHGTGSFMDYFYQASGGQLNLSADVFGWYSAANGSDYYRWKDEGSGVERTYASRQLVAEAIDAAEASGVDFSQYDNDQNGYVDGIFVIHSGPGAEIGAQTQYIWSHGSTLENYYRSYDGVIIDDYMIGPETRPWGMSGIGIFCHEFGHMLGLPDLEDADSTDGSSYGIGDWGLMGSGYWLNNESSPAGMCAWSKAYLGWISPEKIDDGTHTLLPSVTSPVVYRLNTTHAGEYFLLENRQQYGLDQYLPGKGMAVWHIDENQFSNADETHKLVDLEEADGQDHLDNEVNRGDEGDLYPGSSGAVTFNTVSNPNSFLYSGLPSNIDIHSVNAIGDTILFTLNTSAPDLVYYSHSIDDDADTSSGDGDGLVEAGETIEMGLTLANEGTDSAHHAAVYLSITDPDISLINNYGEFGNIAPGGVAVCGTSFDFSVAAGCPEKDVVFTLEISADEGSWSDEFILRIYTGSLWKPCNNIIAIDSCGPDNSKTFTGGGAGVWNGRHCGYSTPGTEQVYSFVATETGSYKITVTAASGYVDYSWKANTCGENGWTCIDDISTTGSYGKMTWTAGKTYYLLLDDENSVTGTHKYYINCPEALTPKIEYYSHVIDDDSLQGLGDGDGHAEPGEFIRLGVTLWNAGTGDARNISAVLSCPDADIHVSDDLEAVGDIASGALKACPGAFLFSVAEGSPEKDVTFTLVVTSDEGKWTEQFAVHIYPGILLDPCDNIVSIDGCGSGFQQEYSGGGSGTWNSRFCNYSTPGTEQVYRFVAPLTGTYSLEVTAASGYVDYAWKTTPCGDTGWICMEDIAIAGTYGSMSWTEGTTYYILLDDENANAGVHRFYINCPVVTEPYIEYAGLEIIDDSTAGAGSNDSDGKAEHGEWIRMPVTLFNNGTADAVNVTARLSSADSSVRIIDGDESFGDILMGAYITGADGYVFSVTDTCGEKDVTFTIEIKADKGSWTYPFTVHIYFQQPNLTCDSTAQHIAVSGTDIQLSTMIVNQGENASPESQVCYFLSADTIIDETDYMLAEHQVAPLAPGTGVYDSLMADVLSIQPGLPEGSYYVGYMVDCNDSVIESDEGDNAYYWHDPKVTIHYCPDSFEVNNTMASAFSGAFDFPDTGSYSHTIEATIHDPDDADYYRLDIREKGALTITLHVPPDNYDIWLLDASGGLIDSSILEGMSSEIIAVPEIDPGSFYVLVNGRNGAHSCIPYSLHADWETWCPIPGEPVVTASKGAYCDSVIIGWNPVNSAVYYDVYRRTQFLVSTASTHYTDIGAPSDPAWYSVQAGNACGISHAGSDTGFCIGLPARVDVLTATDQTRCYEILLEWGAVEGATGYVLYRDGAFLATVMNTTYLDTDSTGNKRLYEVYSSGLCGTSASAISDWGSADTSAACYTSAIPDRSIITLRLYPNPVSDELFIGVNENTETKYTLCIYNSTGDAVMIKNAFTTEKNRIRVDVHELPPGHYQIRLIGDRFEYTGRFDKIK